MSKDSEMKGLRNVQVNIHHSPGDTNKSQAENHAPPPLLYPCRNLYSALLAQPKVKLTIRRDKSHTLTNTKGKAPAIGVINNLTM
jgi:hypothetical protein